LSRSPFWAIWVFWGYVATSGANSDFGFLLGDPDFLFGRRNSAPISLSYRGPHFGLFGFFGGFWGYLATSGAKSDVIFLLSDPDFLLGRQNFAPILLSYRDFHLGRGVLGGFWGDPFTRVDPKCNQVVPWSLTPSLKISCKSVQPFSRNVANKEINKQKKQPNKSLDCNIPSPYWGRGN